MTNKEWLDYLAHNAPDELAAWFDAEHVETANATSHGDTAALDAKSSDDSREKLEADAGELTADYAASGEVCDSLYNGIIELLDRQAAITERECVRHQESLAQRMIRDGYEYEIWELEKRVKELTAERDEPNSRAERTCKQEERGWGTEGDHARVWLTCGHDCMVPTVQDLPNYCPSCGCKVVSE